MWDCFDEEDDELAGKCPGCGAVGDEPCDADCTWVIDDIQETGYDGDGI